MHKDEHRRTDGGTDDGTDRRWDRQTVGRTEGGTGVRVCNEVSSSEVEFKTPIYLYSKK